MRLFVKLAGIAAIMLSCACFGFLKSFSKRQEISRLEKIDAALARADNMLRLGAGDRKKILSEAFSGIDGIYVTADGAVDNLSSESLNAFFREFGKGDVPTERQRINRARYEIKEQLEKEKKTYASSGKIWQTSGVCIGVSIGIMLI